MANNTIKKVLVVGGANGIGLSIATEFANRSDVETVYIVDKAEIPAAYAHAKFHYQQFDLTAQDYSIFNQYDDIDALMFTAGFGRLALFRDLTEEHIISSFQVNTLAAIRVIKHFYNRLQSATQPFRCGVMVSIAGFMSSPFFSVYAATKAALKVFIESVNVELEKTGSCNCILNVSPGSLKGTSFSGKATDLSQTSDIAKEIITHLENGDDLFIPMYDEIFHNVLERYHADFREEGRHSFDYKIASGRVTVKP